MKGSFYLVLLCLFCHSCVKTPSASQTTAFRANPLPDDTPIYFLQPGEPMPDKSEFVREIEMGQSLFSQNCSYKQLMNYARFTAKQSGANLIHLTNIRKPIPMGNGCYQITAKLYRNLDNPELTDFVNRRSSANRSKLPEGADYAVIYFYRPKEFEGAAISYTVKMDGNTDVGRVGNGAYFEYKVTTFGKHKFSAKTRKQDNVTMDIEKGKEYFIRCGVAMTTGIASPDMYVMDNYIAREEYPGM